MKAIKSESMPSRKDSGGVFTNGQHVMVHLTRGVVAGQFNKYDRNPKLASVTLRREPGQNYNPTVSVSLDRIHPLLEPVKA